MRRELRAILKLRVPVIVRLGHRRMAMEDVLAMGPGAIIELPQQAEKPLSLLVNNKVIGEGEAVKIGENFGLRLLQLGTAEQRVQAMAAGADESQAEEQTEDQPEDQHEEQPEDQPEEQPDEKLGNRDGPQP